MTRFHPLLVVRVLCSLGLACLFMATSTVSAQSRLNPSDVYRYNGLDREQRLIEGARKDGTVIEARAGGFTPDVFETDGIEMEILAREKLLAEFTSPSFKEIPAAAIGSAPWPRAWARKRDLPALDNGRNFMDNLD